MKKNLLVYIVIFVLNFSILIIQLPDIDLRYIFITILISLFNAFIFGTIFSFLLKYIGLSK